MGLKRRHDYTTPAPVPALGKVEIKYPSPNIADRIIIERVPITPEEYEPLPYHSPHETYDVTGLFLVWQGKVKAENNQVVVMRVYSNNLANDDWYNASMKFSGDAAEWPIWIRTYIELREDFEPLDRAIPLETVIRLQVTLEGAGYTSVPDVSIGGDGSGATARAIMNPDKTKVIGLELLTAGENYTAATVAFIGGSPAVAAEALAFIQNAPAVLVKEDTQRLESGDELASLFWRVQRIYETLPGPWLPFTRYDENLGPIQGRRRSVLNTGQLGGIITPTGKLNYEARDGSAIVSIELEETWSDGSGIPGPPPPGGGPPNPNAPYPIWTWDLYIDERGAIERKSQLVLKTGNEVATLNKLSTIWTKVWYEPFKQNPFLLEYFMETWSTVLVDDLRVTSEHGGGVYKHTERTDEPGVLSVETGFMVMDSKLVRKSPDEQVLITDKLDPASTPAEIELLEGGEGYTSAPAVNFVGGVCGTLPTAQAILGKGIDSVTINNGGEGYFLAPAVSFRGGDGGGGFAIAILGFGVFYIRVTNGGSGYELPPIVNIAGDGSGATALSVLGKGVASANVTNRGSGYTAPPRVIFTRQGNFGYGAAGRVVMGSPIGTIHVAIRGTSYETPPDLLIDGSSEGFEVLAVLGFGVDHINIVLPGSGFFSPPEIIIGPPDLGDDREQATAEPILTPSGVAASVVSVQITVRGQGYTSQPTVGFGAGSGVDAAGTAILGFPLTAVNLNLVGQYDTFPPISLSGGGTGPVEDAVLKLYLGLLSRTLIDGGFGWAVNDIVDIQGGTHFAGVANKAKLKVTSIGSGTTDIPLTHVSDGDINGVFYKYGTNFGRSGWGNPITAGRIVGFYTNHAGGAAEAHAFVDRALVELPSTTDTAGTFAMFDFGTPGKMLVDKFSIRSMPGFGAKAIRNFKVQGSNNVATNDAVGAAAATWDDISIHVIDTTMPTTDAAWATYDATEGNTTKYRHVRVLQTGLNEAGDNYFNQTEFEFYGVLGYTTATAITAASIEQIGKYDSIPTNPAMGSSPVVDLTYASAGDTNGYFHYAGTNFVGAGGTWTNPHNAGRVTLLMSTEMFVFPSEYVDRNAVPDVMTLDAPNQWVAADLGAGKNLVINKYILRNRGTEAGDATRAIRTWKLQGSNNVVGGMTVANINAATWDNIKIHSGDLGMPATLGSWGVYDVVGNTTAYRWIRIFQDGPNAAGDNFLAISEIELYGVFSPASGVLAKFDLTWKAIQITLESPGFYESTPTVVIGPGISNATATAVLGVSAGVLRVDLSSGGIGYSANFPVAFGGGGSGGGFVPATGNAIVSAAVPAYTLVGINVTNRGRGYTGAPPLVQIVGGGVSGLMMVPSPMAAATAQAFLETSGELWRVDVIDGGVWEVAPEMVVVGGGGAGASVQTILDAAQMIVGRIEMLSQGVDYKLPPLISFADEGSGTGLEATAVLGGTGRVLDVEIVTRGSGYTIASVTFTPAAAGPGSGAAGSVVLQAPFGAGGAAGGSVARIIVLTPGLYQFPPQVIFLGNCTEVAEGTPVLLPTGSVMDLELLTPGNCTEAPEVEITGGGGSGAEGVFYPSSTSWPTLRGFHTDPVEGIVIKILRTVVPHGKPHPGRLNFIDMQTLDRWRSIQIVSKVDITTLPPAESFPVLNHRFNIPPKLLSVEAIWSETSSRSTSSQEESAAVQIGGGASGGVILRRSGGYSGYPLAEGIRQWSFGPFAGGSIRSPLNIVGSSGSIVIVSRHAATQSERKDNGANSIGDSYRQQVHEVDASNMLVGTFDILNSSFPGPDGYVEATSGGGTLVGIFALGVLSEMTVSIPQSVVTHEGGFLNVDNLEGQLVLVHAEPQKWRFNVWVLETIYVRIPFHG